MNEATADIMGIKVANVSMSQSLAIINESLSEGSGGIINFLNAHCANVSCTDESYRTALCESDYIFGDGSGVKFASILMGTPLIDNVNGTDLAPLLFKQLERTGKRLMLLGGKPGVAKLATEKIVAKFPEMEVPQWDHGFRTEEEWIELAKSLAQCPPDLILVALGVPLQEKRIIMLSRYLPNTLLIGVGGLIDFLSERISRAPVFLRKIGMEWTWRLYQEPGRMWRRYLLGNIVFVVRILLYLAASEKGKEEPCKL
jgi:N-acetylglucosaminyldiphosphoundecaprenol N-acetyl-beta-D-mannosaminyltransferase